MGTIGMTRVDARLVHGQVAARWTKYLDANKIIIISDSIAADDFMIELFNLAAPMGTQVICFSMEKAIEQWQADQFGNGKLIVLFQEIDSAKAIYDMGFHYQRLNIGQVPGAANRRHAVETVSLSNDELDKLISLQDDGVQVYFQSVPDVQETPLSRVRKKLKG